jgi:hypothetical protein
MAGLPCIRFYLAGVKSAVNGLTLINKCNMIETITTYKCKNCKTVHPVLDHFKHVPDYCFSCKKQNLADTGFRLKGFLADLSKEDCLDIIESFYPIKTAIDRGVIENIEYFDHQGKGGFTQRAVLMTITFNGIFGFTQGFGMINLAFENSVFWSEPFGHSRLFWYKANKNDTRTLFENVPNGMCNNRVMTILRRKKIIRYI